MKKLLKVIVTALLIAVISVVISAIGALLNKLSPIAVLVIDIVVILLMAYHIVDSK